MHLEDERNSQKWWKRYKNSFFPLTDFNVEHWTVEPNLAAEEYPFTHQLVYSINAGVKHLLCAQAKLWEECEPGIHDLYNQDCSQPKHYKLILIVKWFLLKPLYLLCLVFYHWLSCYCCSCSDVWGFCTCLRIKLKQQVMMLHIWPHGWLWAGACLCAWCVALLSVLVRSWDILFDACRGLLWSLHSCTCWGPTLSAVRPADFQLGPFYL